MFITNNEVDMDMGLSEKEIREKVEDEGALHVLVTFEMVG
jgi:hypothetical protein